MKRIRTSLRARFLAAMILPAFPAIVLAAVLLSFVHQSTELAADRQDATEVAHDLASLVASGQRLPDARTLEAALPNDQITVKLDGRLILSTPLPTDLMKRTLELTAVGSVPPGSVTVSDYSSVIEPPPYELLFIAAIPILLLVISTASGMSYLSRALRRRIGHATHAADRMAEGDFSTRMGLDGQGEFGPLARAFNGMAARLESADQNQRQFLGDLAHEIATPVTAISASALALADGVAAAESDRRRAAEHVINETRRLQALLSDLQQLTRLDITQTVRNEDVSVDEICRDIVTRFIPLASTAGVQLGVGGRRVTALADRRLLEMVIGNFISNALRYTPAGGKVLVEHHRHRNDVVIEVRDTGIGIAPEYQERIFDRFYRIDQARQRATGGSGLGLSIAHRAARGLRGHIEVRSEPGVGSTFRVVFPAKDGQREPSISGRPRTAKEIDHQSGDAAVSAAPGRMSPP